ncbi:MAG: histidine kinase dimerization/phospho-acceptor domain-containing protein, partial [Candidatus Omnitrophota bacterium]
MPGYSFLHLFAAITSVILGIFVLLRAPQKKENITFFMLCGAVSLWLMGVFYYTGFNKPSLLPLISKICLSSVIFACIFYAFFVYSYFRLNKYKLYFLAFMVVNLILEGWLLFGKNYITGFRKYQWGYYPIAGIGETIQMLSMIIFMFCIYIFFLNRLKQMRKTSIVSQEKNRLKYIALSLVMLSFMLLDYLPKFGINFKPLGSVFFIAFTALMTYSIVKHNLWDINIVIRKGLIYSILISLITVSYIIIALLVENMFRGIIGYRSLPITIITITLLVVFFQPLKNYIQRIIDKYFFHGTIDQIDEENIKLREELQKTEKLKAVATLAAGMAHEIKNPLTSIKTFNEYLPSKHKDLNFVNKFNKIVGGEVDRINYIVKQLLEFSKPSEPKLKEASVTELLDETLDLLNTDFLKHNIKLKKKYSPLPLLKIDPLQIKQVFLNILLNAIDSMK